MFGTLVSNCWAMPRIVPPLARRRVRTSRAREPPRSGMDRAAGAAIEANRLHDRERRRPGVDLDVGTAQHAGVFRDDGGGRVLGDGVEVGTDPGPHVLSVVPEKRPWVDRGQRLA